MGWLSKGWMANVEGGIANWRDLLVAHWLSTAALLVMLGKTKEKTTKLNSFSVLLVIYLCLFLRRIMLSGLLKKSILDPNLY